MIAVHLFDYIIIAVLFCLVKIIPLADARKYAILEIFLGTFFFVCDLVFGLII